MTEAREARFLDWTVVKMRKVSSQSPRSINNVTPCPILTRGICKDEGGSAYNVRQSRWQ